MTVMAKLTPRENKMRSFRIPIAAAIFTLLIAACATTDPEISGQLEDQAARIELLAAQLDELFANLEEMQAAQEEDEEEMHDMEAASTFELAVAQYVMDTAGFHAIDDALAETGEINPATASVVARVARMVGSTQWPEDLSDHAGHLSGVLADFEAALSEDDVETATSLAGMAHDHQHDLSAAITAWLSGEMSMGDEHEHEDDGMESMDDEEHEHDQMSAEDMAAAHDIPEEAFVIPNPFAGDEGSTALGSDLYMLNCSTCHGETGLGDGPTADSLEKPPSDLHAEHVQGVSDGGLFYIISHGKPDTGMPAWEDVLDEDARWHLVSFLRTFQEASD